MLKEKGRKKKWWLQWQLTLIFRVKINDGLVEYFFLGQVGARFPVWPWGQMIGPNSSCLKNISFSYWANQSIGQTFMMGGLHGRALLSFFHSWPIFLLSFAP